MRESQIDRLSGRELLGLDDNYQGLVEFGTKLTFLEQEIVIHGKFGNIKVDKKDLETLQIIKVRKEILMDSQETIHLLTDLDKSYSQS